MHTLIALYFEFVLVMLATLFIWTVCHVEEKRVKYFPGWGRIMTAFPLVFFGSFFSNQHCKLEWFIIILRQEWARRFGTNFTPSLEAACQQSGHGAGWEKRLTSNNTHSKSRTIHSYRFLFCFLHHMFHFIEGRGDEQGMKVLLPSLAAENPGEWKIHHNWVRNGS